MPPSSNDVDAIDALLPQTQCTQCGYAGCRPYAQAIAQRQAAINRCPPGGADGIRKLAEHLHADVLPLDESCGQHLPLRLAVIAEEHCIGCTLCIQACPVDAIVGANKQMHTVLADRCTGCDLCTAPCPVDCITLVPAPFAWTTAHANAARQHHQQRLRRLNATHAETLPLAARTLANKAQVASVADPQTRQHKIADALARARARRTDLAQHADHTQ